MLIFDMYNMCADYSYDCDSSRELLIVGQILILHHWRGRESIAKWRRWRQWQWVQKDTISKKRST